MDGDGFVQILEEALDAHGFVVALGDMVNIKAKEAAGSLEDFLKRAALVDNDEATHAELEEDFLIEDLGEVGGSDVFGGDADGELCQVAHDNEEVLGAGVVRDVAGGP